MMEAPPSGAAVFVRDAFKYYGSSKNPKVVLDHLNMTVPSGTIYGLLGASGCGKTTLLTCIVGRRRLKSGHVAVLGGRPGSPGSGVPGPRVGYMPQDIALLDDFTIRDTMFYFGKIFGMSVKEVEERASFLYRLLELPPEGRTVGNLSGGQKRRVSLAAALLHDPELLILDEPTVGVDPVLRQRIWDHLMQITRTGNKSVIITTHYIEEARQAHTIGMMRNGVLLAEDSPETLLTRHGCDSLEEVFLLLSKQQGLLTRDDVERGTTLTDVQLPPPLDSTQAPGARRTSLESVPLPDQGTDLLHRMKLKSSRPRPVGDNHDENMEIPKRIKVRHRASAWGKMSSLLKKNCSRYWRNASIMSFMLVFPIIQICTFFIAIGHDPQNLPLAVVNDEVPFREGSMPTVHDGSGPAYETNRCNGLAVPGCNMTRLSCRFLDNISPEFVSQRFYATQSSAQAAVKAGQAWGMMYFGPNFTESIVQRREYGKDTSDETLSQGEIPVWLDMSDRQIGYLMKREFVKTYQRFYKSLLTDCKESYKHGDLPIRFNTPIYGPENPSYTMFMAPGVILTVVFFLSTGMTCTTMISEVHEGIWDRALVTGITGFEILMSHVITQVAVLLIQAFESLGLALFLFSMDVMGSILLVTLLTLIVGFCGMCFGFLISIICENISAANYLSIGSFYPMILLCGIMWPLEGMSYGLRVFALLLPLTRATSAMRNIIVKGWGLTDPAVYDGFVSSLVWSAFLLALCFFALRIKKG